METLSRLWQDLRYATRVLLREPAFTVAAVLSLALGIGATTAVFSIADTVFLRPLPYTDAKQLLWVAVRFPSMENGLEIVPSPDYVAWRRDNHVFQELAAGQGSMSSVKLLGGPEPAEIRAGVVSANFLEAFAAAPLFGRTFRPEEELPNGPKAVLLMNQFWRDRFHSRSDILGSVITLDAVPYTIIGVLPQSFVYPADVKIDVLTTLPVSPLASHRDRTMSTWSVFGRLKPGVTLAQARADIVTLFAASKADAPKMFRADNTLLVQPLSEHRAGNTRTLLFILMGAAGCLLAIACLNVANLLLARWSASSRELAVRAAIGAARGRLARQLFTEVALLLAAGTVAGMLLVFVALRGFVHFGAGEFPRLSEVTVDFRVFGIALLISLGTALTFGSLPALRTGQIDLHSVLLQASGGRTTGGHQLLRRVLIAVEMALSVVLLSGAALLFETLWHLQNDHLGFHPEHVITVSIPMRGPSVAPSTRQATASDVLTYLRRIPGTEAAALTQCTPITSGNLFVNFSRSDRPLPEPFHRGDAINVCITGPDFLRAAGTRLIEGRFFTDQDFDHPGTHAVLNETAARTFFPGESALGKQVLGNTAAERPWMTVVGIVADTKNNGLHRPPASEAFVSGYSTADGGPPDLLFLVRTLASESGLARALREELRADHPGLFTKTQTLDAAMDRMTASPRFNTVLISTFAAVALIMAIVGVYGLLVFSVTQRSREIGIRMAIGASPRAVVALVMKEGLVLVAAGAVGGVAVALALTRSLTTLLYGVKATDPRTYTAVIIGLVLAATAASFVPARKASVLDPAVALRHE